jgi:hypothetical protein
MGSVPSALAFLLMIFAGWVNRHQLNVIGFLQAENRLLKERLRGRRIRFTDAERALLARKAKAVGRKSLLKLDTIVSPDTLLRWHRRLVVQKWNFAHRRGPGRPGIMREITELIIRMAQDNPKWGYTRIQGALANLRGDSHLKRHFSPTSTLSLRRVNRQPRDNSRKPGCFPRNLVLRSIRFASIRTPARAQAEPSHRLQPKPVRDYDSSCLKNINAPRQRAWRRLRSQAQVREDELDHRRLFDRRDDLQLATALRAALDIDVEHAFQKARPTHAC